MLIKQWKFLTTPTIRGAAVPGSWAQSDCAVLGFSQLLGVTSKGPLRQLLPTLPPLSPQTAQPSQAPADLYTSGSCFPLFPQPAGPVALLHLPLVVWARCYLPRLPKASLAAITRWRNQDDGMWTLEFREAVPENSTQRATSLVRRKATWHLKSSFLDSGTDLMISQLSAPFEHGVLI